MKKIILLFTGLWILTNSFAATKVIDPGLKASEIFVPVGKTGQRISLLDLTEISIKEFEKLRGYELSFFDRLRFKKTQRQLRNQINLDGTISSRRLEKFARQQDGEKSFHLGGFLLGLFLGPIGVAICYFTNDDYKRDRVRWAWRGFLAMLVIAVAIIGAAGG
ncbi:MAG: hypothetical protein ACHQFX_08895 [Chitinophagales bacterium]